jgi:hypothetical protein
MFVSMAAIPGDEEIRREQIRWLRSFSKAGGGKYRAGIRENGSQGVITDLAFIRKIQAAPR